MTYLAMTEAVATWLLGKAGLIDSLYSGIVKADSPLAVGEEFLEGPFHIGVSSNALVIGIWNADYLNATGEEEWGFVRIKGDLSLAGNHKISREVFERCLYVISQRLQGLMIDGAYFPRSYANEAHTCLAGRGSEARQFSIAYFESVTGQVGFKHPAIICVGPEHNFNVLQRSAEDAGNALPALVTMANGLIATGRKSKLASPTVLSQVREFLEPFTRTGVRPGIGDIDVDVSEHDIDNVARLSAAGLTYSDWIKGDSNLTPVQRRILMSDAIEQHPIRIVGPGGSGKTLLMLLLAVRRARQAEDRAESMRIIYVVHNQAMAQSVRQRFDVLLSDQLLRHSSDVALEVKTLSQIARELLEIEDTHVIDTDAHEAKLFQYEQVREALVAELQVGGDSKLLNSARDNKHVFDVLAVLIMHDISLAIKGQGLSKDRKRYVQSARSLSRFHGILSEAEREFVFRVFERYHREVFETMEVLDSDDLAISLLGRIRTPIWELRRRQLGYDYVFVDETQLFNENERRIIPLLTNGIKKHVPVVLALDEAQAFYGLASAGFAALGIEGITSESLSSIHRSTRSIIELAFFVIQRSTDLFGSDFPDFTNIADKVEKDSHPLAGKPRLESVLDSNQGLGKFVLKRVREIRKSNIRQIGVIVHAEQYWSGVLDELRASDLPLHVMLTRGERVPAEEPIVVLTQPAYVGGQEFDAVVLVGLEQGVTPPRMVESEVLSTAVEQQALREIYVSLTRARFQVVVVLSRGAAPTGVLADAAKHGLLQQVTRV